MREVILHIGMHKTGTTSIQNALRNINGNGFRTIDFAEANHSIPMYTIFSGNRLNYHIWKKQGYTDFQIIEKKIEYEKILEDEIRNESINCFLLSGEDMSLFTESEQRSLCEFFKERNLKVRIIYVVRDPISFAASLNQQLAKGGSKALAKVNPEYKRRISGFIEGCGYNNISIVKYEHLAERGLIKSFSEIIGVKLDEVERVNESVTSEALGLIYALNNMKTPSLYTRIKFDARNATLDAVRIFFSKSNGFKKLNLLKFDLIDEAVAEDLVWLEKNFGISYQPPVKAEKQELVYDECPSAESLSEFFRSYALKFDPSLPLADNLENLYARFVRFSEINSQIKSLKNEEKWLEASKLSKKAIELGDERHSAYRLASNISRRLRQIDDAVMYAKKAIDAKDNNDTSRANHKEHLANILRIAGQFDDALAAIDEKI